jgi:uncharacterized protein YndB with AHSA1/START domain
MAANSDSSARALVITRLFDAPRALVFKAWNDREFLVRWWGPQGFQARVLQLDLRVGGGWRISMRSPAGTEEWQQGIYREIVAPERMVFSYAFTDAAGTPGHQTVVTVNFADEAAKTRVTVHQAVFESVAVCDDHVRGWGETLERLAACLTP